jgi:hypothetical protein
LVLNIPEATFEKNARFASRIRISFLIINPCPKGCFSYFGCPVFLFGPGHFHNSGPGIFINCL